MAVKLKFNSAQMVETPTIVLAKKSGQKIGAIPATNIHFSDHFNSANILNFKVEKKYDNTIVDVWDEIKNFKLIWCPEWDAWFEITVEISESNELVKNISARSLGESELSAIKLFDIQINTEDDISRDDYVPTIIYNGFDEKASAIHRILSKAPHYKVIHVDPSIANIQKTFTFDDISVYDAFNKIAEEVGCIFIISQKSNADSIPERGIYVYDLQNICTNCGYRGEFTNICPECGSTGSYNAYNLITSDDDDIVNEIGDSLIFDNGHIIMGYGNDTPVFISNENIAKEITLTTDVESVNNCFKLETGDDLMTAVVMSCNPNGSEYIWHISNELRSDMSDELVSKLSLYDEDYAYYQNEYEISLNQDLVDKYNNLVEKYSIYNTELEPIVTSSGFKSLIGIIYNALDFELYLANVLMPSIDISDTNAVEQASYLTSESLSPLAVSNIDSISHATVDLNVLSMAKSIIRSTYKVTVKSSTYDATTKEWVGILNVVNYSDDTDEADTSAITIIVSDNYEKYIKQKIEKLMRKDSTDEYDIESLFKKECIYSSGEYSGAFPIELKKYSLGMLKIFHECCQSCLDILVEEGVSDKGTWTNATSDLYQQFYKNYFTKLGAIESEMTLRENEIEVIQGISENADNIRDNIQSYLDFKDYIGEDLWKEFCSYRRESTYSNANYVSDGLTNAELIERAKEFIDTAQKELLKSSTLQHSISINLNNLLAIPEFEPIIDYFQVGNWIRVKIDGEIYKLRLISYSVDFDNVPELTVEFSDVINCGNDISDLASIINQAQAITTSYQSVERQASKGEDASKTVDTWFEDGLNATLTKIVNSADSQTMSWDSHGFLMRKYDEPSDSYSKEQLKIINSTLAITDDNWETTKTAIGKFVYKDPVSGDLKDAYGINGETIVGKLIIGEEFGIYNESESVTINNDGIVITSRANDDNPDLLKIRKDNGDGTYDEFVYLDENGNFKISGNSVVVQNTSMEIYLNNTYSTKEELEDVGDRIDAVDLAILPDNIYATVKNATTWTSDREAEIAAASDAVTVGARNLVVGTGITKGLTLAAGADGYIPEVGTSSYCYIFSDYGYDWVHNANVDDLITISFDWTKSTSAADGYMYPQINATYAAGGAGGTGNYYFKDGETSGHYSNTFKLTANQIAYTNTLRGIRIRFYNQAVSGDIEYTISNLMVEKGNKATDWSPAPEDLTVSANLSPFFSHDLTDIYDATTNPKGYWRMMYSGCTALDDGWVHIKADNSSGTTAMNCDIVNMYDPIIKPDTDYTFLFEFRNMESIAVGTGNFYIVSGVGQFYGTNLKTVLEGNGSVVTTSVQGLVPSDGGIYTKRFVKKSEAVNSANYGTSRMVYLRFQASARESVEFDVRVSVYKGVYMGPYVQYGSDIAKRYANEAEKNANDATDEKLESYSTTEEMNAAITLAADGITSEVSRTYATQDSVNTLGTTVTQNYNSLTTKINQGDSTTMTRVYGGGVLVGKVGQNPCALVNANNGGSFDIVAVTWNNDVPTVTATLASFGSSNTIGNTPISTIADIGHAESDGRNIVLDTMNPHERTISASATSAIVPSYNFSEYGLTYIKSCNVGDYLSISFDWVKTGESTAGNFYPQIANSSISGYTGDLRAYWSDEVTSGHYTNTFKLTQAQINGASSSNGVRIRLAETSGDGAATITISNLKCERGTRVTRWSVAPEETGILYGVCSTSDSVSSKTVTCPNFVLTEGATIHVLFEYKNTAAGATLNVNDTGAKPIYVNGASITSTFCPWHDGETVTMLYDGTAWHVMGQMNINADNIVTGTLNAIRIVAKESSDLAGWIVDRSGEPSLRSEWKTIGSGSSAYQYQTALKSTSDASYGVIFVKNKDSGNNETYPFYVRPDGSAYSKNPTWQWHYGDETNCVQLRQTGNANDKSVSFAKYVNNSQTPQKMYPVFNQNGMFLPTSTVGVTVTANGATLARNTSFSFGSVVFLNVWLENVSVLDSTNTELFTVPLEYAPASQNVILTGIYLDSNLMRAWIDNTNGKVYCRTALGGFQNVAVFVQGYYSLM